MRWRSDSTAVSASSFTGWRIVVSGGLSSFAIFASSNPATRTLSGTLKPSVPSVWRSCAASGSLRQTKASGTAARLQQTLALQFPERALNGRAACAEPARERLLAREAFVRFVFAVQDLALERIRHGKIFCATFGHGASISFRRIAVVAETPPPRKTCQCSFFGKVRKESQFF